LKAGSLTQYCAVVTGAGGLIGRRLVGELLAEGAAVIAIDIELPAGLKEERANYRPLEGELFESLGELASLIEASDRSDTVFFHMAGISHAGRCEADPSSAFEINLTLTLSALEFCKSRNVGDFVFPSTGILYGDALGRPAREDDRAVITGVYGATKLAAEAVVKEYSKCADISATIVRFSNIYGAGSVGGDTVIGTLLAQLRNGEPVKLRDLTPVRDFLYLDDAVEGMISVFKRKHKAEGSIIYNISSGVATSIRELAELATAAISVRDGGIQGDPEESGEDGRSYLVLDNSRIMKETGWSPRRSLRDGLLLSVNDG